MRYDAIIVGAGPNGLAAAITLARAGCQVLVLEAKETIGGGARTMEITLPGFRHDICSAVHPFGVASPFFRSLPLEKYGLEWIQPPVVVAHPFDDASAVAIRRSIPETAAGLGQDGPAYQRLMEWLSADWQTLLDELLSPFPLPPRHPFLLARFGLYALRSARGLAESLYRTGRARAAFAGIASHAMLPLDAPTMAAYGLVLGMLAHPVGWPLPQGGSQAIMDGMAAYLSDLGGEILVSHPVTSLKDLPPARATLFDLTPRQVLAIAGVQFPPGYRRRLERFRYGQGVFKADFALSGPVLWTAPEAHQAGTLHLGGTLDEIAAAEDGIWRGRHAERPYIVLAQPSRFDPSRAPAGKHTLWAYCHVPAASTADMTERVIAQIERFAPGFRDLILACSTHTAAQIEAYNPNYVGGDINGGVQDWRQLFTRPVPSLDPYATPLKGVYFCSSSTPPGGGVHGMCGYHAAKSVLRRL